MGILFDWMWKRKTLPKVTVRGFRGNKAVLKVIGRGARVKGPLVILWKANGSKTYISIKNYDSLNIRKGERPKDITIKTGDKLNDA